MFNDILDDTNLKIEQSEINIVEDPSDDEAEKEEQKIEEFPIIEENFDTPSKIDSIECIEDWERRISNYDQERKGIQ